MMISPPTHTVLIAKFTCHKKRGLTKRFLANDDAEKHAERLPISTAGASASFFYKPANRVCFVSFSGFSFYSYKKLTLPVVRTELVEALT